MSTQPKTFLTPEEYLEIERRAAYKSEYCEGEMFALAGAPETHNLIAGTSAAFTRSCVPARVAPTAATCACT